MGHRFVLEFDESHLSVSIDGHTYVLPLAPGSTAKADDASATPAKGGRRGAARTRRSVGAPTTAAKTSAAKSSAVKSSTAKTSTATTASAKPASRKAAPASAASSAASTSQIRAWATGSGKYPNLSSRGPLPREVREAYAAANAG